MNAVWIIAKKELFSFFDSLMAYIMLVLFLGFSGFFTWIYGSDVFFTNQASMDAFFSIAYWSLFFFIPALTMRQIAEEKKTGTLELLFTKPITDFQIIAGKYLSTFLLIAIALGMSLPYYITISNLGKIDHGAVWSGYLGLLLMSSVYISIGLFSSSMSNNQIVSFLLALTIGIVFHIILGIVASGFSGVTSDVLDYLSMRSHFDSITRGVIDLSDIVYFLSLTIMGLVSTETLLARRNLNN